MCCHPYDRCGPVYGGPCQSSCSPCYRANSTLAGTASPVAPSTVARRQTAEQPAAQTSAADSTRADAKPGVVAGSQRILSVTDRKVESPVAAKTQSEVASESSSDTASHVTSTGWTAVRPINEITR